MVHKDNAVEVESVDAFDSRDHVVHPGEGLLVRAGRPLFCHYHHSLVSQDIDGEYRDSGDLGGERKESYHTNTVTSVCLCLKQQKLDICRALSRI